MLLVLYIISYISIEHTMIIGRYNQQKRVAGMPV